MDSVTRAEGPIRLSRANTSTSNTHLARNRSENRAESAGVIRKSFAPHCVS